MYSLKQGDEALTNVNNPRLAVKHRSNTMSSECCRHRKINVSALDVLMDRFPDVSERTGGRASGDSCLESVFGHLDKFSTEGILALRA